MVETIIVKNTFKVALNEKREKIESWVIIFTINKLLEKARINASFEISQQNESGEGTLITLIANDCEKK